ncbi:hypothetical protein WMY93_007666 [Mugilogobius chulae]|uniref:NACHT domain-containing protein n=1 Tax=Mugilogobius chulae TaxID=88201 RepID=A0AAW0PF13_9GOBI
MAHEMGLQLVDPVTTAQRLSSCKPHCTKLHVEFGSVLSMKSHMSKDQPIHFSRDSRSVRSMKSDMSKDQPLNFSTDSRYEPSMKSNMSKEQPLHFRTDPGETSEAVRVKSDLDAVLKRLEDNVLRFVKHELKILLRLLASDYPQCSESEEEKEHSSTEVLNITVDVLKRMNQEHLAQTLKNRSAAGRCDRKLKSHLQQRFSYVFEGVAKPGNSSPLNQIYTELYIIEGTSSEVNQEHEVRLVESASKRVAAPEKTITCEDMFKPRPHSPQPIRAVLMEKKRPGKTLINTLYGIFKRLNKSHKDTDTTIKELTDRPIIEELTNRPISAELTNRPIRLVLTVGVAGVGKTVLTQKFSLDWAEGRTNQELQLLFPFTFRELNVLRDTQFSLVQLLQHFFSPSKALCSFTQLQVLFIFDGLDECRLPLDFSRTRVLTDPTESVSVDVLLVNLIRGSLLPSALLWITTRPAAANQIPEWCISMVTEVRGFTDPQKDEYFRKRFTDDTIISHIKSVRSLYIMSYIPIFCWILSTVLQKLLEQTEEPELPRTLTQMYVHFLVLQLKQKNIKYDGKQEPDSAWSEENKKMVLSLSKLAFEQLQKGNLIFYENDLSECGLDAAAASVYSGVFTQVFREESGLYQDKVYCFIHLSLQEFLAALHVHQTFYSSGLNLMETPHSSESPESEVSFYSSGLNLMETPHSSESPVSEVSFYVSGLNLMETPYSSESPESEVSFYSSGLNLMETPHSSESPVSEVSFYVSAVDQALQSPNGHLDLFLRFLLGLSLPTNQRLLQGLLTHTGRDKMTKETIKYIKQKLNEKSLSAERDLNLFHCLNELNDQSLVKEIQEYMKEGELSDRHMSPALWSALSFVLLSSDSDLQEFDLRKYKPSEEALLGLLPVVKASTKALLSRCGLSPHSCGPLASVLSSSSLTHLDLSHNDLQDSGVELLCEGLKSAPCRLETLRCLCGTAATAVSEWCSSEDVAPKVTLMLSEEHHVTPSECNYTAKTRLCLFQFCAKPEPKRPNTISEKFC